MTLRHDQEHATDQGVTRTQHVLGACCRCQSSIRWSPRESKSRSSQSIILQRAIRTHHPCIPRLVKHSEWCVTRDFFQPSRRTPLETFKNDLGRGLGIKLMSWARRGRGRSGLASLRSATNNSLVQTPSALRGHPWGLKLGSR